MSTPRDRIEARLGLSGPPFARFETEPPAIQDHELICRIGQGAYGEVWLARNALGTLRAVKIVYRDNFKDARPFEREFAGIRRFEPLSRSNEGLVDILQIGRNDNEGWFYYVMELADNALPLTPQRGEGQGEGDGAALGDASAYQPRTLARDLQARGRLPLLECLELGLNLCLALGHLHRHGLIHRDVKPSNIIFVGGIPKLADIGLVTEVSDANTFVGTEGFVPPEGPTSSQADLYALGKVLYEAAMGKDRKEFPEPFTQISADAESLALMELNSVLLRACARDPKERYQSAEEMHADLALLHSGGSVKRRHLLEKQFRIAQRIGAIAAALAFLAVGAWLWQERQTGRMSRLASEKAALALEKTKLAENLAKLGDENRNRVVRSDIANGVRLLDEQDPSGALLWFSDALRFLTNNPSEEAIHRIRIQQTLDQTPRLLRVFPHQFSVGSAVFSPDGRFIATGTQHGFLQMWNATNGAIVWGPKVMPSVVASLRFSKDGRKLFASSSRERGIYTPGVLRRNFFAVVEPDSGQELFSSSHISGLVATNLSFVRFSPDDLYVAVAKKNGALQLIDLSARKPTKELPGHTDEVQFISFSEDGTLMASASVDRSVRVWRVPSGDPVGEPLEHRWPVILTVLIDEGRHLITGSFRDMNSDPYGEFEIQVWNVSTGKRIAEPFPGRDWMYVVVDPAKKNEFAFSYDGHASLQKFSIGSASAGTSAWTTNGIQFYDFNRTHTRIAAAGFDNKARILDANTGEALAQTFNNAVGEHTALQFSPDESQLLTAGDGGAVRLWRLRDDVTESARKRLAAPLQKLKSDDLARTKEWPLDGSLIYTENGLRRVRDNLEETPAYKIPNPEMNFAGASWGSRTNVSVTRRIAPDSDALFLWWSEPQARGYLLEHPDEVWTFTFTYDDRYLLSLCRGGSLHFWRTSDGQLVRTVQMPAAAPGGVGELSADGRTALWVQPAPPGSPHHQEYRFYDLDREKFVSDSQPLLGAMLQPHFSPDGKQLALLDWNGPVTLVESRTSRVLASVRHPSNLIAVQWDPECRRLLTVGASDQVLVWDTATGAQLFAPLQLTGGAIRFARWSPDGRFIVARNDDKKARVWDAATGEPVTPILPHDGEILFAYMTRGNRVVTVSFPDLLRAWDLQETTLSPDVLRDYAKLLSGRYLNESGVVLSLKPDKLALIERSLRERAPHLFE